MFEVAEEAAAILRVNSGGFPMGSGGLYVISAVRR